MSARKRFKKIYIEITNKCNLACSFCPGTNRQASFMPVENFAQILDNITGFGTYLYFHIMGEPLLHPQLDALLDLSYKAEMQVNLTTNGTKIADIGAMLIGKPALRQVNFSMHCLESALQAEIDHYLANLFTFIEQAATRQIYIGLRLWNLEDANDPKLNAYITHKLASYFKLDQARLEELTPNQGITLARNVYLNPASVFEWPSLAHEAVDKRAFCYGLRDQIGILVDGTVVPCCLDSEGTIALGNILDTPLETILANPRAENILQGFSHQQAVEELCQKCGYRQRFN